MNKIQIGTLYENYMLAILKCEYDNIWLTKEVPSDIVKKCNFERFDDKFTCDIGFDILAIKGDIYYFIQCKNFLNSNICIDALSGFYHFVANYNNNNNYKFLVYYNGKISHNIIKNRAITYINISFDNYISNNITSLVFEPKYYQIEAYEKLRNNKKSILNMPCGMGKTYISYLLAQDYDTIIIFSPLKVHTQQILNVFKSYDIKKEYQYFLISSDDIRSEPKLDKKNIISITYDSSNVLNKFIQKINNPFIIIDEYHNLSKNDISGTTELGKILTSDHNILLISATPEKYNGTFNEQVYVTYKYKWKDAIDNGYLSDYRIYFPVIDLQYGEHLKQILKTDNLLDDYWKAYNIIYGLKQYGHIKCIIYINSISGCTKMVTSINFVNLYFKLDINVNILHSAISKKKRSEILNTFLDNTRIQIICNVHLLDEAINIPECDSVYIISDSLNIVKIIQRVCRCNRKTNNKVSGIYLWGNNIDQVKKIIVDTFNDQSKIIEINYKIDKHKDIENEDKIDEHEDIIIKERPKNK